MPASRDLVYFGRGSGFIYSLSFVMDKHVMGLRVTSCIAILDQPIGDQKSKFKPIHNVGQREMNGMYACVCMVYKDH